MTLDPKATAAIALHRFGLGPRPGSIAAIASDPRGALLAELDKPDISRVPAMGLRSSAEAMRALFDYRAERQARVKMARREAERQRDMSGAPAAGGGRGGANASPAFCHSRPGRRPGEKRAPGGPEGPRDWRGAPADGDKP